MTVSNLQLAEWYDRAVGAENAGKLEESLALYDAILGQAPRNAPTLGRKGAVLWGLKRFEESLRAFDAAAAFAPGDGEQHYGRGTALQALDRLEEALPAYDRALMLMPHHIKAVNNRAAVLLELGRPREAVAAYDRAVALSPETALFQLSRGMANLLQGRFAEGWPDYEKRDGIASREAPVPADVPLWRGQSLAGKRLLLQAEQGLGDTIQFSRYAPLARAMGAEVVLQVHARLKRLLADSLEGIAVIGAADAVPACDFRLMLMSMPARLGTEAATIPAPGRYLKAEPARVARWRARLGEAGFKIAIAWQGEKSWQGEDKPSDKGRSFPLGLFAGLAALPGVRLISLQKNEGTEQLAALPAGMRVESLGEDFDAGEDGFLDSVAVMEVCDLTITSDTAIAHLAGALDRPAWVALKKVPDWRWLLGRDDSPWYPSLRLFRQQRRGDWQGVFAAMEKALRATLGAA